MTPDTPTGSAQPDNTDLETTLRNAEQFLIKSGEAVHPDLSASTMLRYLSHYRTHLHAVVTSTRRDRRPSTG